MKKIYFALIIVLLACNDSEYRRTELLKNGIYCEIYRVFGSGVYGGDVYSEYVTDSVNFRFHVGNYDDNNNLAYEINDDTILVKKISYSEIDGSVVIDKIDVYTIAKLSKSYPIDK